MLKIKCEYCGKETIAQRRTKRFCSDRCMQRAHYGLPSERSCKVCGEIFPINRGGQNRKYCSKACAKKASAKRTLKWHQENPEAMKKYNENRFVKVPGCWREKYRKERIESIELLGGKCVVCGVVNMNWLHIDYKPTTNGKPYRHPRHLKYIKENLKDFRLLCANHHYELTLTGKIEGSNITQKRGGVMLNAKE